MVEVVEREEWKMKKKIVAMMLASVMSCGLLACGGSEEPKEETKTEATDPQEKQEEEEKPQSGKVEKVNVDNSEGTLTYTKHEITTDYEGKPAILVYFDYTNKKEESSYAQMTFYPQVFQNGVECEIGMTLNENEGISNSSKEIQKGTTLNVAFLYVLQDAENPVTLKVTDQSSEHIFDGYYQEQELNVK